MLNPFIHSYSSALVGLLLWIAQKRLVAWCGLVSFGPDLAPLLRSHTLDIWPREARRWARADTTWSFAHRATATPRKLDVSKSPTFEVAQVQKKCQWPSFEFLGAQRSAKGASPCCSRGRSSEVPQRKWKGRLFKCIVFRTWPKFHPLFQKKIHHWQFSSRLAKTWKNNWGSSSAILHTWIHQDLWYTLLTCNGTHRSWSHVLRLSNSDCLTAWMNSPPGHRGDKVRHMAGSPPWSWYDWWSYLDPHCFQNAEANEEKHS